MTILIFVLPEVTARLYAAAKKVEKSSSAAVWFGKHFEIFITKVSFVKRVEE